MLLLLLLSYIIRRGNTNYYIIYPAGNLAQAVPFLFQRVLYKDITRRSLDLTSSSLILLTSTPLSPVKINIAELTAARHRLAIIHIFRCHRYSSPKLNCLGNMKGPHGLHLECKCVKDRWNPRFVILLYNCVDGRSVYWQGQHAVSTHS